MLISQRLSTRRQWQMERSRWRQRLAPGARSAAIVEPSERIANELLLKVGVRISPRTVRKYLP